MDSNEGIAFKVIPTRVCYRHVRHERLLGEIQRRTADALRTGWIPNAFHVTPLRPVWGYAAWGSRGKIKPSGPTRPPQ